MTADLPPFKEHDMPEFRLHQASFHAGDRPLLSNINLELAPGQMTAILGPNGSGKSTLMRLMAGQIRPSGGEVRFRDRPVGAYPARTLARALAHLPQTPPPVPGLSIRDLVALGRYPWHGALGRFGTRDHQKVDEALTRAGLGALADRQVDTLSGGERQRAWIAMLLAQEAGCLLLDEPTSALDLAHQIEVLQLLRDLNRAQGLGVIMVLHDVNLAARFCDQLVALRGGALVQAGPTATVMQPERLTDLFALPMVEGRHPSSGRAVFLPQE